MFSYAAGLVVGTDAWVVGWAGEVEVRCGPSMTVPAGSCTEVRRNGRRSRLDASGGLPTMAAQGSMKNMLAENPPETDVVEWTSGVLVVVVGTVVAPAIRLGALEASDRGAD
jgi:hypothetical protein